MEVYWHKPLSLKSPRNVLYNDGVLSVAALSRCCMFRISRIYQCFHAFLGVKTRCRVRITQSKGLLSSFHLGLFVSLFVCLFKSYWTPRSASQVVRHLRPSQSVITRGSHPRGDDYFKGGRGVSVILPRESR